MQLNQPSLMIRQSINYHNMARTNAHQICPHDMPTQGLRKYVRFARVRLELVLPLLWNPVRVSYIKQTRLNIAYT